MRCTLSALTGYRQHDWDRRWQEHVPFGRFDKRGAIVLQQKVTRHQLGRRLSSIPRCAGIQPADNRGPLVSVNMDVKAAYVIDLKEDRAGPLPSAGVARIGTDVAAGDRTYRCRRRRLMRSDLLAHDGWRRALAGFCPTRAAIQGND